jgi:hypothetical protein
MDQTQILSSVIEAEDPSLTITTLLLDISSLKERKAGKQDVWSACYENSQLHHIDFMMTMLY